MNSHGSMRRKIVATLSALLLAMSVASCAKEPSASGTSPNAFPTPTPLTPAQRVQIDIALGEVAERLTPPSREAIEWLAIDWRNLRAAIERRREAAMITPLL